MSANVDNFFTEGDKRSLEKNKKHYEDMLDGMFKGGTPAKSGEIRVAKEVIESMDNRTIAIANIRAKVSKDEEDTQFQGLVLETLKQAAKDKGGNIVSDLVPHLEDEYMPTDLIVGEMEITPLELELKDFNKKESNEE